MKTVNLYCAVAIFFAMGFVSVSSSLGQTAASTASPPRDLAGERDEIARRDIEKHVQQALRQKAPLEEGKLVVPTAAVSEAIHNAVAGAVYGRDQIEKQQPFRAIRSGEFWVVYGYLPPDTLGGVAVTVLRASNGEVIWITHGQ
jgi:hypothetical protein